MKLVIIGAGIVGLSIAKVLIKRKIFDPSNLLVLDKFSIPSKGTSIRNSGVLHAGLYYKPGSLKAKLSIEGGFKLKEWCDINDIQILECGKILVPFCKEDYLNLDKIAKNALLNGCEIKIIDYKEAKKIQPGIVKKEKYLWSPRTSVFPPELIVKRLYIYLKEMGVEFKKNSVISIDSEKKQLILDDKSKLDYSKYINCAGPGALNITQSITNKFNDLSILPFLGQYVVQDCGINIKTNLYPVPDPELPFLGIHLTPRVNKSTLIGPNAIPIFQKDIQGYDINNLKECPSILVNNIVLFASNTSNYRKHAFKELTFNLKKKFLKNATKYLSQENISDFQVKMDFSTYGIRSQIINRKTYEFINDFVFDMIDENIHIVNAVSPAFTSCFALAEYIAEKMI